MGHTGPVVVSEELAVRLRAAGLAWEPTNGDAFAVPDRDLDGEVFVLSDMVVELLHLPEGVTVLGFNGTTEWALDSLEVDAAVWLPREDQLRALLGPAFVTLEQVATPEVPGFAVTATVDGVAQRPLDVRAADAYARALLALLTA